MNWLDLPHFLMGLTCHQLPERSPACEELVFPACFRCAGLYLGFFAAYLRLATQRLRGLALPPPPRPAVILLLTLPFVVDSWGGAMHLWSTPGWLRAATGWGVGLILPRLLLLLTKGGDHRVAWPTVTDGLATSGLLALGVMMGWWLAHPTSATVLSLLTAAATLAWAMLLTSLLYAGWRLLRPRVVAGSNPSRGSSSRAC